MDINEPSLMDVTHDTINSTQGPALIEVAYSPMGGSHEIYVGRRNQMKGLLPASMEEVYFVSPGDHIDRNPER
ncbi:hypothetical protein AAZX31_10G092200 [Glycine max]